MTFGLGKPLLGEIHEEHPSGYDNLRSSGMAGLFLLAGCQGGSSGMSGPGFQNNGSPANGLSGLHSPVSRKDPSRTWMTIRLLSMSVTFRSRASWQRSLALWYTAIHLQLTADETRISIQRWLVSHQLLHLGAGLQQLLRRSRPQWRILQLRTR